VGRTAGVPYKMTAEVKGKLKSLIEGMVG